MPGEENVLTIHAEVQHLRKVRNEIDLAIRTLLSMLPDRKDAQQKSGFRMLNPDTLEVENC